MNTLSYKTVSANKKTVEKKWVLVDVKDQPLGRAASKIASLLRGKHKTSYTPHVNCGDTVVVINAEKIVLTGDKMNSKVYIRHTGYPGGQRFNTPAQLLEKHPTRVIEKAIKGMLPKTILGNAMYKNLHVYAGGTHPHEAQKPQPLSL